jgi:hypothetical protein
VDADLDTLATALYVKIDDLLKAAPQWAPARPAVGITPKLSDAELVQLGRDAGYWLLVLVGGVALVSERFGKIRPAVGSRPAPRAGNHLTLHADAHIFTSLPRSGTGRAARLLARSATAARVPHPRVAGLPGPASRPRPASRARSPPAGSAGRRQTARNGEEML